MKIIEEKSVHESIKSVYWSPTMDLYGTIYKENALLVQRLNFQKIHSKTFDSKILNLFWRPDGRMISVVFENGKVLILEIEELNILNEINLNEEVTQIFWNFIEQEEEEEESQNEENEELLKKYNILCICTNETIKLYSYGILFLKEIDISKLNLIKISLMNSLLSLIVLSNEVDDMREFTILKLKIEMNSKKEMKEIKLKNLISNLNQLINEDLNNFSIEYSKNLIKKKEMIPLFARGISLDNFEQEEEVNTQKYLIKNLPNEEVLLNIYKKMNQIFENILQISSELNMNEKDEFIKDLFKLYSKIEKYFKIFVEEINLVQNANDWLMNQNENQKFDIHRIFDFFKFSFELPSLESIHFEMENEKSNNEKIEQVFKFVSYFLPSFYIFEEFQFVSFISMEDNFLKILKYKNDSKSIEVDDFIDITTLNSFYHFENYNQEIFFFLSENEIFQSNCQQENDEDEKFIKLESKEEEEVEIVSLNLSKRGQQKNNNKVKKETSQIKQNLQKLKMLKISLKFTEVFRELKKKKKKPYYGHFRCHSCKKQCKSGNSWVDCYQNCKICKKKVQAYKLEFRKPGNSDRKGDKHHPEEF
eukprot:gene6031-10033_t